MVGAQRPVVSNEDKVDIAQGLIPWPHLIAHYIINRIAQLSQADYDFCEVRKVRVSSWVI